ncbi:MAG: ABC-type nitrate/sulfonate/bicarbonate transport system [Microvirga sp.]|nr:ABC-type nitrate/sulfonate/bicarbonate transport system [Microvirga sp.]
MEIIQSRRDFLTTLSAAGAAGVFGARGSVADEAPPETTTLRLIYDPSICTAPGYIADELLRAEGFTDIRYLRTVSGGEAVARGEVDFGTDTGAWIVSRLDAGEPITALAGLHSGCYELFAHEAVRTISDLKGKRIGIRALRSGSHLYLAMMAAQVGLDPHTDIAWVTRPDGGLMELFAAGHLDVFLGFPPEPQDLRARKVGRVILNTAIDKPWSEYFCCTAFGNRDFVRAHPIATKRYLRAILKATDICAAEPERVARMLVDGGFTARYDYALQTLTEVPYDRWREFDPEDALRFYALRLHEVGMVSSSPNAIIAEGADWRFLEELKRELKA